MIPPSVSIKTQILLHIRLQVHVRTQFLNNTIGDPRGAERSGRSLGDRCRDDGRKLENDLGPACEVPPSVHESEVETAVGPYSVLPTVTHETTAKGCSSGESL